MTNEEALVGYQNLYNEIDKDNHLFVGTINPEWIQVAIEALENNDKLAEDLQNCLEMYKKKKAEVEALKKNQWIPCEERLPSEPFGCLLTVWDTVVCTGEEFENILPYFGGWDGEQWNDDDGYKIPFEVIAWMPLPKPYERRTG